MQLLNKYLLSFYLVAACLLCGLGVYAQGFDRVAYYAAFESGEETSLDAQLKQVTVLAGYEKDAFEGALLMRKAGFQSTPLKKLSLFKEGGKKLEAAIKAHPNNVEYRFLRLMIQEHAPKIVGYDKELKEDSQLIKSRKSSLPVATQNAVNAYAKKSKYL